MFDMSTLPMVSLENMNTVHSDEVKTLKTLLERIKERDDDSITLAMQDVLEHMQEHFSSEEKLMKEVNYPSFRMHKAEHDKVLNESRYAEMEWRNRKDCEALQEYVQEEILPWLDQHIKAMDRPMSDFVMQFERYQGY